MATGKVAEKLAIHGGEPVRTKPFGARWFFDDEDRRQVLEVVDKAVDGGWGAANKLEQFEDTFARLHGVKYAFATDSGTGAIHAAVGAVNPEPGDEIITTPVTDIGTVLGIILQNAIPVFADWDPERLNTDPADVERRITDRTRAIIAVHLFGNPCDMDAMMDVGRRHNIPVIEDCSHAHFAEYKGRLVGTIGDMGCYSLGGKLVTAGGGGMFISNNEEWTRRAKGFAFKGSEYDEGLRNSLRPTSDFQGSKTGYSFLGDFHRMSPLMAAVGLAQLGRIEKTMHARGRTWEIVDEMTAGIPGYVRPKLEPGRQDLLLRLRLPHRRGGDGGVVHRVRSGADRGGGPGRRRAHTRGYPTLPVPHLRAGPDLRPVPVPVRRRAGQPADRLRVDAPAGHRAAHQYRRRDRGEEYRHRGGRPRHRDGHPKGGRLLQ